MGYRALPSKFLHPSWWRIAGREFIAEKAAAIAFRSEVIDLNVEGTSLRFQIGDPTGASWYKKDGLDNEDIRHIETYLLAEDGSSIVFEIGCHHGLTTTLLSKRLQNGQLHAFEAMPDNLEILKQNLALNQCENVVPIGAAVGDRSGEIRMKSKSNSAVLAGAASGPTVPLVCIDDYVDQTGVVPDVLKIDVEGFEINVLEGARKTIADKRPAILIEVHTELISRYGKNPEDLWDYVSLENYRVLEYKGNREPVPRTDEKFTMRTHLICIPKSDL